jgi:NAD-dependent dihydropyrimidine dehydrogenase PreA subunit
VAYTISEPFIDMKDKSCIEECPVDCTYEGDRMLSIQPAECVDCGACEPVCPVEAIFSEDDVPAEWKEFTAANAAFFTEGEEPLGSPAGRPTSAPCDVAFVPNHQVPTGTSRPAYEPTRAGWVNGATATGAWWRSTGASVTRRCRTSRSRPAGPAGRRAARSSGPHVPARS